MVAEGIVSFTTDSPMPTLLDAAPRELRIDTGRRVMTCQALLSDTALTDHGTVTVGEAVFTIVSEPVWTAKPWYSVAWFVLRCWWSRGVGRW